LDAHLHRPFIGDADDAGSAIIAGTVGLPVQLVRQDPVQRTRLIDAGHAVGVAEGAVSAGVNWVYYSCYSSSSSRAIGLAAGIVAVIAGPVLPGSKESAV
jgi:hypothetical protein